MNDPERWERQSATVAVDELEHWLERVAADGWEPLSRVPAARGRDSRILACYVLLRRPVGHRPGE